MYSAMVPRRQLRLLLYGVVSNCGGGNSWREKIEQVVFDFFFLISSQLIYHLDVMGREKKRLEDVKLYNFTIGKIIKKIFVRFVIIVHHQFCGSFRERKLTKG